MKTLIQLKTLKEFYDVVENNDKVIIYWYTKWCPDCFVLLPFLGKLEKDFPEYTFYKVDRDGMIDLARHLEIYGIPSFLVFKDHDEIGRLVNKYRKSYKEIKTFIGNTITEG